MALLQRFYDPNDGVVTFDGHDLKTLNVAWLRRQFGYVGQEPVLFSGTIAENIAFALDNEKPGEKKERPPIDMKRVEEAAKSANAHNFIMSFPDGYNTAVGEKGAKLSGGQKQRIAIARAIVTNPAILLLDEATSALDNKSEKIVQRALDRLMAERTTIVIAHRLSTIRGADVIYVMEKGVVKEFGSHDELVNNKSVYADLIALQGGIETAGGLAASDTPVIDEHAEHEDDDEDDGKQKQSKADAAAALAAGDAAKKKKQKVSVGDKLRAIIAERREKKKKEKAEMEDHPVSIGRLIRLNRAEAPYLALGSFAALINGLVNPIFAIVFAEMLSAFFITNEAVMQQRIGWWAIGFAILGAVTLIAHVLQAGMFGVAGEFLTRRLRAMSFEGILRKEIFWFDREENASGALTTRLASDATLVSGLVGPRLGVMAMNLSSLVAGVVIAFVYGWQLTLVLFGCAPFLMFASSMEMINAKGLGAGAAKRKEGANQIATESIANIRTVAAFGVEARMVDKFVGVLEAGTGTTVIYAHIGGVLVGIGQFLMFAIYGLIFYAGGRFVDDKLMTFKDMMTVMMAIMMAAMTMGQTSAFAPDAAKGRVAASRLFKIIDAPSTIDPLTDAGDKPASPAKGRIEFSHVAFRYPTRREVPIFEDLNLVVEPGKSLALVGASGSGKSTVVSLIERFYAIDSGKILVDGLDIALTNPRLYRAAMSIVSQEPTLFSGTIADNIRYGKPDATKDEIEAAAKKANAHTFITGFPAGYNTQVGERGAQLSGGQKQRIAIARAIIRNPVILLLDEATSALDSESEKVVQDALDIAMQGRTTIIIAHRLSTVRHADTIAVVEAGKIVEKGTHDQLVALKGVYYDLERRQNKVKSSQSMDNLSEK
jgi:ATP-binding cassette subfamily B (MDR/TAP) protein 1